ncbi:MAG: putative selenate ABC transporter substrate-binding protein [Mariprofundaceae bacterium]
MMKILFTVLAFAIFVPFGAFAGAPSVLRVSAIPDEDPTKLLRKSEPLVKYLEAKLGMKVKFIPVLDYAATVEGMAAKKLDLVWYGGFTAVQAMHRAGAIPIVQRARDTKFHSKFIANVKSGIKGLEGLKGHTFSFGSVSSTSGHLMPRYYLLKNGIDPEKSFKRMSFSGAHDATAKWVESGKVDAGVLNEAVWKKLVSKGKVDTSKVKVIWTTPSYYDYNWTVAKHIDETLREKIRDAFMALDYDNPEDRKIMDMQRAKSFIATYPENYQGIEKAAKSAGLLR